MSPRRILGVEAARALASVPKHADRVARLGLSAAAALPEPFRVMEPVDTSRRSRSPEHRYRWQAGPAQR
jgi:hypothetical protein